MKILHVITAELRALITLLVSDWSPAGLFVSRLISASRLIELLLGGVHEGNEAVCLKEKRPCGLSRSSCGLKPFSRS